VLLSESLGAGDILNGKLGTGPFPDHVSRVGQRFGVVAGQKLYLADATEYRSTQDLD